MNRKIHLIATLLSFFCMSFVVQTVQAQNLLTGWNNTSGTPYDAGWRVDNSVSVSWGGLNGANNRYRTNVGSPASNGSDPMLYITKTDTKFGYPITPTANKMYELTGKSWRRNGESGSMTFNFYFADNLLATNPVSKHSFDVWGNNIAGSFSIRLTAPAGFNSGYFLWDVHLNGGKWDDAGLWNLSLTELGNASSVIFETNGGSAVISQYFLEGEAYNMTEPAVPTRTGYTFAGWYANPEFTVEFDFTKAVTSTTRIYAKWESLKVELTNLVGTATGMLVGGTSTGQTYLNGKIAVAQGVIDNDDATPEMVADAYDALELAMAAYQNSNLAELKVNGTLIAGFSADKLDYAYSIAVESSIPTVAATASVAEAATVTITQASVLPGDAIVVVTAGNGAKKTYKVNFRLNFLSGWDGNGMGVTTDKPNDFGWASSTAVTWVDASNSNDTYAYRYRDNLGVGRVLTHPVNNGVFSYPVTLDPNKIYRFNCGNSNMNGSVTTMFGINTKRDATGDMLGSQTKTAPTWNSSTTFDFLFKAHEAGEHYLVWQTTNATDRNLVWDLLITEAGDALTVNFETDGGTEVFSQYFLDGESYVIAEPTEPTKEGFIFAGWYADNAYSKLFNFGAAVSENTTIYARFIPEGGGSQSSVLVDNEEVSLLAAQYMDVTVRGKAGLYLTSTTPLVSSTVNLESEDSWVYFTSVQPSETVATLLDKVTINGQPVDRDRDRIAIYGSGTVIIPNGKEIGQRALTIYDGENYQGNSKELEYDVYYRDVELGSFDNNIRSFKLKRGYSCTFANNPNGTGHSRVFIADDEDIEISVMPEGLEFASFVRVYRWEWVSKKGMCNGGLAGLSKSSWFNDWSAGGDTENPDFEFVPMRHNSGWDSFEVIESRKNVSHLLGYNEPDHTDQSNMTPEEAIAQWPQLFKSGLRLGSPTPDSLTKSWLTNFMALADKLNYRVDFVVGHMYWENRSGGNLKNDIASMSSRFKYRPVWITEWNNGANWTNEWWPDASGPQRDADMNIIYDANGGTTTVNRPLSPNNAKKQADWMKDVLQAFDDSPYLERHSFYNWVQDARAVILGDKLTPAGKVFADFKSKPAFNKAQEYIHTWKIAPPMLISKLAENSQSFEISWYDHNGETGLNYVLEKKKASDANFVAVKTFNAGVDYGYGETVKYEDTSLTESAQYRVRALSYKNGLSEYSDVASFTLDAALITKPVLSGEAVSASILDVNWTGLSNARFYTLDRSIDNGATFTTVEAHTTDTKFTDKGLNENTVYQYRVTATNTSGSIVSDVFSLTTNTIVAPTSIEDIYVASGDQKATLTWDFQYDVNYRVSRADQADGTYTVIADNIDGTRYADNGLTNNKEYFYKLEAFNIRGTYVAPTIYNATPVDGRHVFYDFNENAGTVAHDQWGAKHATLSADATWATGKFGQALSFNGTATSYAQLGEGIVSDLEDFTIATWFYSDAVKNNSRIFDFGSGTGTFMVFVPKAGENVRYKITCPAGNFTLDVPFAFPIGEWAHVALTQSGTTFNMFVNGILIGSSNEANVKPKDMGVTTSNYLIKSQWSSDPYNAAKVDEFKIFNRALDDEEIVALMNDKTTGIDNGTSIDKENETRITIYPNPVKDVLYLKAQSESATISIDVYSNLGSLVLSKKISNDGSAHSIDVSALPAGVYVLKIVSDNQAISKRIIKK